MTKYVITKERTDIPEGFRNLTEQEIANEFLKIDADKDYFITKNEWMLNFLKLWANDIETLNAEGPDSIMDKIEILSEEFDSYDLDGNKCIDYLEYKNFLLSNILISD